MHTESLPLPKPLSDDTQVNTTTPTIDTRVNVNNQRIRKPPIWLKDYVT